MERDETFDKEIMANMASNGRLIMLMLFAMNLAAFFARGSGVHLALAELSIVTVGLAYLSEMMLLAGHRMAFLGRLVVALASIIFLFSVLSI